MYIKDPQPKRKNSYLRKLEERSEMKIIKINTKMKKITVIKTSSTTAVDLQHLKVKGKDFCLTKNNCITISIQKNSPIHKLILKMQQILRSHEQNSHGHFWPCSSKNHWINFLAFLNLYLHAENQFVPSVHILRYSLF